MNSRERVLATINHQQPDRVPIDLGATGQTGISASTLYKLRVALGLEQHPVHVSEIYQMLGEVEEDLLQKIGADVIGINSPVDLLGCKSTGKKPFFMSDGTPVLIGDKLEYEICKDGSIHMYPQGDRTVPPSAKMPAGGFFFDNIDRVTEFDEDNLTPTEDFKDSFSIMTEEDAKFIEQRSIHLFENTEYGIIGNLGGAGFGDSALVPGPYEKHPKGIRRFDDWLMAHLIFPDYIKEVYEMQTQVMLKNLEIYRQAVGNRIQIIWISGTDFGTQNGAFYSNETFRELYKPYYKRINDWVHKNTEWKTFYHTCGSVVDYLDDFVDMGMDILNPVQLSAKDMDACMLKEKYGDKLTFWGGGVDTQATLPFGTPDQVYKQVLERLDILSKNGGYVFSAIHNIVAKTPIENLIAMFDAVHHFNA
ncbi:uroporphyrinogen decarboxylase family protein [Hydrogenoanaerobacterium sp.]|uniref:uroporphyrinogen decarboxylase family protein n=1 Tax=Hydrogenoanaerobacterium sp. TaxID=2953763 RepID=UPI0028994CA2|nr:uroporphyrinogen decarboxylase family protein [Hydrogenoanaerobacterium sp.]